MAGEGERKEERYLKVRRNQTFKMTIIQKKRLTVYKNLD